MTTTKCEIACKTIAAKEDAYSTGCIIVELFNLTVGGNGYAVEAHHNPSSGQNQMRITDQLGKSLTAYTDIGSGWPLDQRKIASVVVAYHKEKKGVEG